MRNFKLSGVKITSQFVDQLKEDIKKYRVLLFKDQGKISGEKQVELSRHLGKIESTFYKHPASPHPDIFRVSNDERQGCTGVGRTGWHIDGTFLPCPFKYQTMHFHASSSTGFTKIVPLKELIAAQPAETQERWNNLWFAADRGVVHPMTYKHWLTGEPTMVFHCGRPFCAAFVENFQSPGQKILEPAPIQDEITEAIEKAEDLNLVHTMKWDEGDFAIIDNLAVAHYAVEGTQDSPRQHGLRILHRTTIMGEVPPKK